MNSRVSWSVDGIDPSVRERAEAAARRAGMSLSDWLNSTIGESAPPNFRAPPEPAAGDAEPGKPRRRRHPPAAGFDHPADRADFAARAAQRDAARRSRPRRAERRPPVERRHLAPRCAAVADFEPGAGPPGPDAGQAAPDRHGRARRSPGLSPLAAAEPGLVRFRDRRNRRAPERTRRSAAAADAAAPCRADGAVRPAPPSQPIQPPPMAPAAPAGPDFSSLERHLVKITSQIEALQRPDHVEQSIAAFRSELAEIRHAITEAMPRRAIESIENEIRSLSRRIDDTRQNGSDGQTLAGIERALGEIHEVLRSLTPAEQLTGYDEAIRNLGAKLDLILRSNDDPSTVHQLEGAIAALRGIVSNVASNDALARLSDDVHTLSAKVDQLSRSDGNGDSFAMLEQRIAALTSTLESQRAAGRERQFRTSRRRAAHAVRTPRPHPGRQRQCVGICPSRTAGLVSAGTSGSFQRPSRRACRRSRAGRGRAAGHPALSRAPACQPGLARRQHPQFSRRAAADGPRHRRHRQARIVRHPLQPVGNRPPHAGFARDRSQHARPCRRSAGDDRRRSARACAPRRRRSRPCAAASVRSAEEAPRAAMPSPRRRLDAQVRSTWRRSRNPNCRIPPRQQRAFCRRAARIPRRAAGSAGRSRRCRRARSAKSWSRTPPHRAPRSCRICRPIIRWSRAHGRPGECLRRRSGSLLRKARSAKSRPATKEPVSSSSFIAAARRAAQAAAAAPPNEKAARAAAKAAAKAKGRRQGQGATTRTPLDHHLQDPLAAGRRKRGRDRARHLQDGDDAARHRQRAANAGDGKFVEPAAPAQAPAENTAKPAVPAPAAPSMISPTPIGRQSNNTSAPNTLDSAQVAIPPSRPCRSPPTTSPERSRRRPAGAKLG